MIFHQKVPLYLEFCQEVWIL